MKQNDRQVKHRGSATSIGLLALGTLLFAGLFAAADAQTYKYDFGSGAAATGYTKVTATTAYSSSQGYGFDSPSGISAVSRGGSDVLKGDYCTKSSAFSFSVKLPLGNYMVTLYLGDLSGTSTTTVYGEQRRLFLDRVPTSQGQVIAKTFAMHRRDNKNGSVVITQTTREPSYVDLDEKLTLQFSGSKPCVCGVDIVKVDTVTTLFLCGNSTVVDQPDEPYCGWGQMIPRFFTSKVSVANYAESGLRTPDFITQYRLAMILTVIKPGDYVFIEFGHNDQKDTPSVVNYPANLQTISDSAIARGAIPVFVTPTARQKEYDSLTTIAGLAEVMRTTAKSLNVRLLELNAKVLALKKVVTNNGQAMYVSGDSTHFTNYGAFELARCVAKGMKEINLGLAQYLNGDLPDFDLTKPDPTNYLTTSSVAIKANKPVHEAALLVPYATTVHAVNGVVYYKTIHTGNAEFVLYSSKGEKLARIKKELIRSEGSYTWEALDRVAPGLYLLQFTMNHKPGAVTFFNKM